MPIDVDVYKVNNLNTGQTYPLCDEENSSSSCLGKGYVETGQLEIMNDSFLDSLSKSGSNIRVTGQKADLSFEDDYVFLNNGCPIEYVSGPETIILKH